MLESDRVLIQTTARAILDGDKGTLAEQVTHMHERLAPLPTFTPTLSQHTTVNTPIARPHDLSFDNSWGGFSADGKEYIMYLEKDQWTPAP